jgi:hypothetical protein
MIVLPQKGKLNLGTKVRNLLQAGLPEEHTVAKRVELRLYDGGHYRQMHCNFCSPAGRN